MIGPKIKQLEKEQQLILFEKESGNWFKDYWGDFGDSLGKIIVTISFRLLLAIVKSVHIGMKVFINEMTVDLNREKIMKTNLGTVEKKSKNERISVSFGRTINNGNYESTRIDFSFARDLNEGENKKEALLEEFKILQTMINEMVKPKKK